MKDFGHLPFSPFDGDQCLTRAFSRSGGRGPVCPQAWQSCQGETVVKYLNFTVVPEQEKALQQGLGQEPCHLLSQPFVPRISANVQW